MTIRRRVREVFSIVCVCSVALSKTWTAHALTARLTERDATRRETVYATQQLLELIRALPHDSSGSASMKDIAEHVCGRCEHASPRTARKALALTAKLCAGEARFQREMVKLSGRIRAMTTYVGEAHASKGDALNEGVRKAAREALEAIFGTAAAETSSASMTGIRSGGGSGGGGSMTSLPSSFSSGFGGKSGAGVEGASGSRMGESLGSVLMSAVSGVGIGSRGSGLMMRAGGGDDDENDESEGSTTINTNQGAHSYPVTPPKTPKPGVLEAPLAASLMTTPKLVVRGEGATKWKPLRPPSPPRPRESGRNVSVNTIAPSTPTATATQNNPVTDFLGDFDNKRSTFDQEKEKESASRGEFEFNLDGSEEQRTIEKLCTPSSLHIAPLESDVDAFLRAGARLYARGVVVALSEKLVAYAGDAWRTAYRAVIILERASTAKEVKSGKWLADVFVNSSAMDLLDAIAVDSSADRRLAEKAASVAQQLRLGADHPSLIAPSATAASASASARANPIDLLSQLGDLTVAPPQSNSNLLDELFASEFDGAARQPSVGFPPSYQPPLAPMRGPGLAALEHIPPPPPQSSQSQTAAFDFVGDLMK